MFYAVGLAYLYAANGQGAGLFLSGQRVGLQAGWPVAGLPASFLAFKLILC